MSKFLARLGGAAKKREQSPGGTSPSAPAAASPSSNGVASSPSSPRMARRASKQLLNFGIGNPGTAPDRAITKRNDYLTATPSAAPKIELDFGGEPTSVSSSTAARLQSTGVGLQSPITGVFDISEPLDADSRKGDDQKSPVISKGEVELLRKTRFTWTQVEKAWTVAGEELKIIGLKTPDLFRDMQGKSSGSIDSSQVKDETNRLLAIFTISTSPSPSSLLPSFPSLSDYYPPVSFIPQTSEWYENDFKTNVGWVKDPRVLVRFLKTVTRQLTHEHQKPTTGATDPILPEWYNRFKILERTSSYPTDAFTRILSPLISPEQYKALCTIFDIGAVVTANAASNGCLARDVFCGYLGWWAMGSRLRDIGDRGRVVQDGRAEGWMRVYRAWEEARDAMYHLFKAWIRNQERTGTLPLLVLEHVTDYQARLEKPSAEELVDVETVLECGLSYQLSTSATPLTYTPTTEDLVEGMLTALDNVDGGDSSTLPTLSKWQSMSLEQAPPEARDGMTLVDVIRAIRDAQYPNVKTKRERLASTPLPQTPNTKDDDSIYRPFRTPSSSSFMQEGSTPTGQSSPGVNAASPPRTPHTPISTATTPGVDTQNLGARSRDSANWTDFAQTGFGETVALPKPFVLGEAFKQLKIRDGETDRSTGQSRGVPELGLGRPRNGTRLNKVYSGIYNLESYDTTRLSSVFIGFEQEARLDGETESWPHFGFLHLDVETTQRLNLCSRYLLVSVKIVNPEPPKPESPPAPIEKDRSPVSFPLQTPPLSSDTARLPLASAGPEAEKRNRRRSFFRSFSGGSSKSRKVSSPITISSPMESPLPAVVEKREPVPLVHIAREPELPNTPPMIQAPQPLKLSPNHTSQPTSLRSRSPSSVYRKPVPILDETELRELEGPGSSGEIGGTSGISLVKATESLQAPVSDSDDPVIAALPRTTDVDLDEYEEVIRTDSPSTSLSVTDTSDVAKSPHRRRRSGAPSPTSLGYINGDLVDSAIPAETSEALVDGSTSEESDEPVAALEEASNSVPALGKEPPDDAQSEYTVTNLEVPKAIEDEVTLQEDITELHQAPVLLGAVL